MSAKHRASNSATIRPLEPITNGEELESLGPNGVENTSDVESDNDSAFEVNVNQPATNDVLDTSSSQDPSSVYQAQFGQVGYEALKFIAKFVDRVCMEGCLNDQQRQALHANLVDVISMQIQTLETVCNESRRVLARSKPKIDNLKPDFMLHGER